MKRLNYLYTIERNGVKKTIVDAHSNPLIFLAIEQELGNNTVILFAEQLSQEEYQYWIDTQKQFSAKNI